MEKNDNIYIQNKLLKYPHTKPDAQFRAFNFYYIFISMSYMNYQLFFFLLFYPKQFKINSVNFIRSIKQIFQSNNLCKCIY